METNNRTAPITPEKDRNAISLDQMHRMKLHGMAAAFTESLSSTFAETMTPDSFLSWLLAREWDYRSASAIERLIRSTSFRYKAYPEEIDYTISRGLDRIVHSAHQIELTGESIRKMNARKGAK